MTINASAKKICMILMLLVAAAIAFMAVVKVSAQPKTDECVITELEPSDARLVYNRDWEYMSEDGSVASTTGYQNTVSYTGTFTTVEWWGEKSENMTSANVYIDGELIINHWPVSDISERNTSELLFTSGVLERGEHTICIEHSGYNGGWISVDKLVVIDDAAEVESESLDDADARMQFSGFSAFNVGSGYYASTVHSTNTADSEMWFTVENARRIVLHCDRSFTRGKMEVSIDGGEGKIVNLFDGLANDTRSYPVYVSPILERGVEHTVRVKVLGTKDIKATDCWVAIDRAEIIKYKDSEPDPSDWTEFDDSSFGYGGAGWGTYSNLGGHYFKGTAHSTPQAGDFMTAVFLSADSIQIWGTKAPNRAKAEVFLDGKSVGLIDTYSPTQTSSQVIWSAEELGAGVHSVRIVNTGKASGKTGETWLEIDKVAIQGANEEYMLIQASNNSFVRASAGTEFIGLPESGHYRMSEGDILTVRAKGSGLAWYAAEGYSGAACVRVDGDEVQEVREEKNGGLVFTASGLDAEAFHKLTIECVDGKISFAWATTDDLTLTSLDTQMRDQAEKENAQRKSGEKKVSDPSKWNPVAYVAEAPVGGVTLTGGTIKQMFEKNLRYLNNSLSLPQGVETVQDFWVNILSGSNEGRLMQGYANSMLWGGENAAFRAALDALMQKIRSRQSANGGYALPYEESAMAGYMDAAYDERRNYDRAMFTRGLVAAGAYYESIGLSTEENPAYIILRNFYDWFNYNENEYGLSMLEGFLGVQGHIGSTLTYFTPVGKTEDMLYAELCYVQDWWIEYLSQGIDEAVWRYPLNRPHCYLITAMNAYLDHYRATGEQGYLDACLGFWDIMHDYFIHPGGSMAICEHMTYEPGSYYTKESSHTGELCGTVFWTDFNYRLLQLFPNEEKYAAEIEKGIYNVLAAAQDDSGRIRYHQNLNGLLRPAEHINSCCEVTATGLIARLPQFLYQLSESGVTVSLYNDSVLNTQYAGKNYYLTTEGDVFADGTVKITNLGDAMTLRLRIPTWVSGKPVIKCNGKIVQEEPIRGTYAELSVQQGDEIELFFEQSVYAVKYTGYDTVTGYLRYYLFRGPVLLSLLPKGAYTVVSRGEESILDTKCTVEEFIATVCGDIAGKAEEFAVLPYSETGNALFSACPLFRKADAEYYDMELPKYDTKDLSLDFDCLDFYGETGKEGFRTENGALISSAAGGEQKALLPNFDLSDGNADIRMRVSSINPGGAIDGGLYLGVKDGIDDGLDTVTAYNINIERAAGENMYRIKIHQFDYNGGKGKYLGCIAIAQFVSEQDSIEVRVIVRDGCIYVYNSQDELPCIVADVGLTQGGIGFRAFRLPMRFEAAEFVGASNEPINPDNPPDGNDGQDTEDPTDPNDTKGQTGGCNTAFNAYNLTGGCFVLMIGIIMIRKKHCR